MSSPRHMLSSVLVPGRGNGAPPHTHELSLTPDLEVFWLASRALVEATLRCGNVTVGCRIGRGCDCTRLCGCTRVVITHQHHPAAYLLSHTTPVIASKARPSGRIAHHTHHPARARLPSAAGPRPPPPPPPTFLPLYHSTTPPFLQPSPPLSSPPSWPPRR